jgi:hypothetical protein
MRLPHHSKSDGPIVGATRSVSGHPQGASTQKPDKSAADGQAHENRRLNRSFMDNRNHSVCHLSGSPDLLIGIIIPLKAGVSTAL